MKNPIRGLKDKAEKPIRSAVNIAIAALFVGLLALVVAICR